MVASQSQAQPRRKTHQAGTTNVPMVRLHILLHSGATWSDHTSPAILVLELGCRCE
jgi:hypothetical protein